MKMVINFLFLQIYNVCDQIAQCEDGSDEGPEVRKEQENFSPTFSINFLLFSVPQPTVLSLQKSAYHKQKANHQNQTVKSVEVVELYQLM